jgi:hypothetical protein
MAELLDAMVEGASANDREHWALAHLIAMLLPTGKTVAAVMGVSSVDVYCSCRRQASVDVSRLPTICLCPMRDSR